MHICKYEAVVVKKCPTKHIYTKQRKEKWPAISWKKKFVLLSKCINFCNIRIRTKEGVVM